MGGPIEIFASGQRSSTDSASTCAASWRISSRASGLRSVTISIDSPPASGAERSRSSPFPLMASAALASPEPIAAAASAPVAPPPSSSEEPSGSFTWIFSAVVIAADAKRPLGVLAQLAGTRNSAAVHPSGAPMGIRRPRSVACGVVALTLLAALPHAADAKAMHKHPFGSRVLQPGTKGKDVRYLQRSLTRLGVATAVDGAYGKGTMKSVEALESQRGWPVNGVISRKDAKRIRKLIAKSSVSGSYFVQGLVSPTLTVTSRHPGNAKVKVLDVWGRPVLLIPVSFSGAESHDVPW